MKLKVQKFLETSSIHGLAYISKRYHFVERIFWAVTLIFSAICTLILITKLGLKLKNFPIVVYLSDTSVPISKVNFPAVTICPEFSPTLPDGYQNKQYLSILGRYEKHTLHHYIINDTDALKDTVDERKFLGSDALKYWNYFKFLERLENGEIDLNNLGQNFLKRLQVVDLVSKHGAFQKLNFSVPTDDFLDTFNVFEKQFNQGNALQFKWVDGVYPYLSEIMTPFGLCFTFNMAYSHDMLHVNSTSSDFHFQLFQVINGLLNAEPAIPDDLPRNISTSMYGLESRVIMHYDNHADVIRNEIDGFKYLLHDPFELPTMNSKIVDANCGNVMSVSIDAQFYSVENSLISYAPKNRNCYFDDERKLKFFKKYTKPNCIQECLSDFMVSRCGCVEYFMIRNSTSRICRGNEKNCFDNARNDFENHQNSCGCLQPCNYIKYDYSMIKNAVYEYSDIICNEQSFLTVFIKFKSNSINQLIRKRQFNEIDFLSYFGGLLGLFAGFSVMSFFELIYWFLYRVISQIYKQRSTKVHSIQELNKKVKFGTFRNFLKFYLNESSIHGLRYVAESGIVDRILWIIFILSSMIACYFMISLTREKVPNSLIIAYDDFSQFNGNFPFPAITIVPEFSYDVKVVGNIMNVIYHMYSIPKIMKDPVKKNEFLRNITRFKFCKKDFHQVLSGQHYELASYVIDMLKRSSKLDWFINQTSSLNLNFQPIFTEIRTPSGMAFTFNMIDANELLDLDFISESFNYTKNITTRSFKNSIPISGGLTFNKDNKGLFAVKLKKQAPDISQQACFPVSLLVHENDYLPTFEERRHYTSLKYGQIVDVEVVPEIIRTDDNLRSLKPEARECYFEGEKSLKFFKKYSRKNCLIECFANITFATCSCFYLTQPFVSEVNLCQKDDESHKTSCIYQVESKFQSMENFSPEMNCMCLNTCNSVTYHVKQFFQTNPESDEISINLRVSTEDAILYRRYQQFTFSDVVSYVGGLLGLFAGISMLSIVEIFYFFVIRVAVNIFRSLRI